jgi:hypothetical protein
MNLTPVGIDIAKTVFHAKVRDLLQVTPELSPSPHDTVIETRPVFICRHCGAPMIVIEIVARSVPIRAPPMRRGQT